MKGRSGRGAGCPRGPASCDRGQLPLSLAPALRRVPAGPPLPRRDVGDVERDFLVQTPHLSKTFLCLLDQKHLPPGKKEGRGLSQLRPGLQSGLPPALGQARARPSLRLIPSSVSRGETAMIHESERITYHLDDENVVLLTFPSQESAVSPPTPGPHHHALPAPAH